MATKLYLRTRSNPVPEFAVPFIHTDPSFWDGSTYSAGYADGGADGLDTDDGSSSALSVESIRPSVAGPLAGIAGGCWMSLPVAAAFTLSGTVTFSLWAAETNTSANMGLVCRVYKISRVDGSLTQVVGDSAQGTELGTTATERSWTVAPTSTSFEVGDRLMLFTGYDDAGGNMASGFEGRMYWDSADTVNGDSFLQLTEDITFVSPAAPSGSKLYLLSTASAVDDGNDEREMWTAAGSSLDTAVRNSVAGPTSPLEWTKTGGGTVVRWYSRQLGSFTLSGIARVKARLRVSATGTRAVAYAELARVDADGTNAQVWAYGPLAYMLSGTNPSPAAMDSVDSTHHADLVGPALGFNGHRLRLRIFIGENNWTEELDMVSGRTATLEFNGSAENDQSWLQLTETVAEYTPPGPVPGPYVLQPARVF